MVSPSIATATTSSLARDGRDARWEAHRTQRRRQLVEAALKAIRRHGAGVGMDDIAAQAGTSKTVLYRHLGDRTGVYLAVVDAVDELILADLGAAVEREQDAVTQVAAMVGAYLELVERDPEIYRFVVTRPLGSADASAAGRHDDDPVHRLTGRIGERLTTIIADHRRSSGADLDLDLAACWGHGVVGFVRAAADHWLDHRTDAVPVAVVTAQVTAFVRPALTTPLTATEQEQR